MVMSYYIMVMSYIHHGDVILHHGDVTYTHGMSLTGMKKPLVNPATLEMTGDRRMALSGKEQMRAMRRAVQVWLRAMFTTTN